MSIVGTRPPLISETNLYELHHKARLAIKPGITGMWQVSGRSDITDFEEVVRLDREYISKLYIQTGKKKDVSKQLHANPKAELCAFKGGEWIRVAGELVEDDRVEARQSMLDAYPSLKKMYAVDDGNTEVFYFKNGVATISSFTHEPKVIKF